MTDRPQNRPGAWMAFAIVSAFFLFEFVARIEPSLASEQIATWFNLSNGGFGTLSSIFFWIYAPMQLIVGLVLDRYGPRRFVVPAILIMSAGVALFAWTSDPIFAGVGRFLTGLGASFGFVSGLYVVNHWFAPSRFAVLSGAVNALGMLGTAIGAVALTRSIEQVGWQPVFYATAAAGVVLFFIAALFFHDNKDQTRGDGGSLIAPLRVVVSDGRIWWIAVLGALYYMPVSVFGGLWGKAELTAEHGLSSIKAETAISMIFWGMAIGSVAAGWVSDRIGHRKWIVVSNVVLAALAYSAAIYIGSTSVLFISVMLFFGGLFGGAQMLTFAMAKEGQPKAITGTVIAFVNMIGIAGALIFQPLIGSFIDMSGGAFGTALLTIPVCLVVSALMAIFVSEHIHEDHTRENH
ncbi:MFS transporter [Roseobacter ponti]|uniref:Lysosomal dipeptide transporter MFSD1 n=1 Tax=Roseobacter ponti TaxID=1891787 RepID=A0A858SPF8_9RHOB|nr:MFS transporter [Roseobacter ponti]QJF50729.1 MFS transporter [Roseobacter ponti]